MRYVSKQFLSPCPHETGSMVCLIETPLVKDMYNWGDGTIRPNLSASVSFRACHGEPVNLDFDAHDQKGFEKRMAKVSLMIQELEDMRRQMGEMWYSHLRDCEFKTKQLMEDD